MLTRREVLVRAGASVGSIASLSKIATADVARGRYKPDHVTLTYDEALLERYRPRLEFGGNAYSKLLGVYGWYATSPEYETDVAVYWASYSHQEGVSSFDSHYGDHEPVYVFVNSTTGEMDRVVFSAYHWLKGVTSTLTTDHPRLHVIAPWHHYTVTTADGVLPDIDDLHSVFDAWLANGLGDSLAPGAVVDPWSMRTRPDWWRRGTFGISGAALLANVYYTLGLDAAGQVTLA